MNSENTAYNGYKNKSFFLVGHKGAGKTCIIGGLALYAQNCGMTLSGTDDESKQYLHTVTQTLQEGRSWPRATSANTLIRLLIRHKGENAQISVLEYAGEIVAEDTRGKLENFTPEERNAVWDAMREADYILLLLDSMNDFCDVEVTDKYELEIKSRRRDALFQFLQNIMIDTGENKKRDIALVLSKSDCLGIQTFSAARKFIQKHARNAYDKAEEFNGEDVSTRCFPVAVRGENTDWNHGDALQYGFKEICDWIFDITAQTEKRNKKILKYARVFIPVAVLVLFMWFIISSFSQKTARNELSKSTLTVSEMVKLPQASQNRDMVDRRIDEWLGDFQNRLDRKPPVAEIEAIYRDVKALLGVNSTRMAELRQMQSSLQENLDHRYYEELKDLIKRAKTGDTSARASFTKKKDDYSPKMSGSANEKVRILVSELDDTLQNRLRREIHSMHLFSRDAIRAKIELMTKYAEEYLPDSTIEKQEIMDAVQVAERLIKQSTLTVSLRSVGNFSGGRIVRVHVSTKSDKKTFDWSKKSTEPTWDESKTFRWIPGDTLIVQVEVDGWTGDYIVREAQDGSPLSIRLLGNAIANWDAGAEFSKYDGEIDNSKIFRAIFSVKDFSKEDWQLLDKYVYPGEFWK